MYYKGQGVPQDYTQAVRWLRLAAGQGIDVAQNQLGLMYYKGQGVPLDYTQAHVWLNLATSNITNGGDDQKKYAEARDLVAMDMTPQQIAEAQRRAREWKPTTGGK
jgi:hypothetical protein